jgi:general L-amino acid transport system substrate-binding protein
MAAVLTGVGLVGLVGCGPEAAAPVDAVATSAPEVVAAPGAAPVAGPTLMAIRERGRVNCTAPDTLPGFGTRDVFGQWRGFDVDFCRAVAAAVLGDARLVQFEALDSRARYTALQAGQIDLIPRGNWTYTRDSGLGLDFVAAGYYDAQGVLLDRDVEVETIEDLAGRNVCVQAGGAARTIAEHFQAADEGDRPISVVFDTAEEAFDAFRAGDCEALSGDLSFLMSKRTYLRNSEEFALLDEVMSKEPQGPVVRQDDGQWADIVRWTLYAMILGEEFGLASDTAIAARANSGDGEVLRLLNGDGLGEMLLLREDWAFQVIRQVGSYGEVFERNLGENTDLAIPRGQNALWNAEEPGLMFAPPMR